MILNPGRPFGVFLCMELIEKIAVALERPLPGAEAQYRMAHAARSSYPRAKQNTRIASVLLLLYPKQDSWHTLYIQRVSSNPNDRHRGQIAFPGGMRESGDLDLAHTALREAEEEVGLAQDRVQMLGQLTPLYIPVSNFLVHPFIGFTDHTPGWTLQADEVAEIIEVPLSHMRDPLIRRYKHIQLSPRLTLRNVPYFDLEGRVLWGATAMITNEFLELDW